MNYQLTDYLDQLCNVTTIEDLYNLVLLSRELFDVEHSIYHSVQQNKGAYALASYGSEWANYYEKERMYLVDPVVLGSFQKFQPFEWKSLNWSAKPARRLMLDAGDGGVGSQGVSIPIRGPRGEMALFSVNTNATDENWAKFIFHERRNLVLVAHYIHAAARNISDYSHTENYRALSPREVDTLTMLGLGENRARIAEKLKISEHTLRVYIESSRKKLCATNTTNAVAKAMVNGLISI